MSKPNLDVALSDRISSSARRQRNRQGGGGRGGGGGGGGGRRSGPTRRERSGRPTPYSRGSRAAPNIIRSPSAGSGPTTISISNLLPSVDEGDLKEIFGTMGTITRACVHYNRDGRSQGTAEVTFARGHEAEQAIAEYDAAEVDGRPMYLKLIVSRSALQRSEGGPSSSSSSSSSSDQRCFNCNRRGHIAAECNAGRGGGGGGGGGAKQSGGGCFECGATGHVARQCPQREGAGQKSSEKKEGECFVCQKTGHWARECPEAPAKAKAERAERSRKKEKEPTTEDLDADMDDYFKKKGAEEAAQPTPAEANSSAAAPDAQTD